VVTKFSGKTAVNPFIKRDGDKPADQKSKLVGVC
jgi:hypothetical protein